MKDTKTNKHDARKFRRQVRSRISFEIMRTMVFETTGPILIAELFELFFARKSVWSVLKGNKSSFYIYLHRLAERGCVKIEGLRRRLAVVLTREGERELDSYTYRIDRLQEVGVEIPPELPLGIHREKLSPTLCHKVDRCVSVRKEVHAQSKKQRLFYISYDLPKELNYERQIIREALRQFEFTMMHESFYVGPRGLQYIIEIAERIGILPFIAWGIMRPMAA
jgi:hypothetical protein